MLLTSLVGDGRRLQGILEMMLISRQIDASDCESVLIDRLAMPASANSSDDSIFIQYCRALQLQQLTTKVSSTLPYTHNGSR